MIPRSLFDDRLVRLAVARGAELRTHTVRSLEIARDKILLDGEIEARVVVGADGANGLVRRLLDLPRQGDAATAIAVRGYIDWPTNDPEQLIVMDGRNWPAYAWRFDAGDGTSNVGFGMLLSSLRATGHGKRTLHQRLVELLPEAAEARDLRSHHLPLSTARPRQPKGRVLLAGDAASLINPLTGEGIFYALLSGRLAGACAVGETDPGIAYRDALERELGRHLTHTTLLARFTAHERVLDAGVRAVKASPTAMDALVDVGLGRGLITPALVRGLAHEAVASLRRRAPRRQGRKRQGPTRQGTSGPRPPSP